MDPQSESGSSSNQSSLPAFETTHNLLNSSTFLLHLIEPIRIYTPPSPSPVNSSSATRKSDDNNSSEKLKRRLIDALAFICATEREGDSGAAVCIEEAITPEGEGDENLASENGEYTLRIAKNGWVGEDVLQGLRDIMKSLETFADGSPSSSPSVSPAANLYQQIDAQVYSAIIALHLSKVLYHLSEIREPITVVQEALLQHLSAGEDDPQRIAALSTLTASELRKLQTWLRSFVAQVIAADEAGEKRIPINAVSAAYQVRRSPVFGHLELLCKSVGCQVVGVHMIKLGRYKAACRTLMHACQKWPGMFVGMKVEGVPEVEDDVLPHINLLPRPTREMEIRRTLSEITNGEDVGAVEAAVEEGVHALLPTISEEQFATAWAARVSPYTGHAEVRLVEFYEENSKSRPISGSTDPREREVRYIGMSKKPCYLCQMFVDRHPARYMLGGLEGEKPGAGVKRVLDPYWRLRPVGGTEYARLLDEMREAVEQELRAEVEKWVLRGSDEEVLGRERPRGRARAKGKRILKRGKPKLEPETSSSSNASSSDGGGMSLTADGVNGNPSPITGPERLKTQGSIHESPSAAAAPIVTEMDTVATVAEAHDQVHDAAASEDEGEGVKLVHSSVEDEGVAVAVAENTAAVEAQLASAEEEEKEEEEVPDLIFPTADTDAEAIMAATNFLVFSPPLSPPLPNLIDDEPEFLPFASAILYAGDGTSITNASSGDQTQYPVAEPPSISPTSGEFHSEMQFLEESEFKLLSPIPEEEDESLVLVNLDAVLVRLADLEQGSNTAPHAEEAPAQATELPQRARAMSDAERDLLGLDFTFVVAEEPEAENVSRIFEAPPLPALEEQAGNLAPGGYLVPEDLEEGSSIAPGGYFVVESVDESKESPSGGYFVVAAEQAGVALPGGYLAAEAKLKETGAFAPGGYLVAEMKGEVEMATLIQDENVDTQSLTELPELAIQPDQETIVSVEEPGVLAPGGYIVAIHDEGTLVAPGGYFVVPSEEEVSSPPPDHHEQEESGPSAVTIPLVEEGVTVEFRDTDTAKEADVATDVAVNGGNEGSEDTEEGYDVIDMEQEREKKPFVAMGTAQSTDGDTDGDAEPAMPDQSINANADARQEITETSAVPEPEEPHLEFSSPSPIVVPTAEKLGSMVSDSPDVVHVPSNLGSSPSSSTHTTLSTSTTLANNSTPTTPRLRSSASLLFAPSLRRASTWAPPTTATTMANTPAITSSLSGDVVLLPDSRPGTALGDHMDPEDGKPVEIRPVGSGGGWLAKRLMRAANTANGVNGSTATDMEVSGDRPDILPRRGSFSSTRSSTVNGGALSGTAKALITLRALQVQVRQKK